jgi:hypothetical protein
MDNNVSFSKIVATPNLKSWSQAYNAGKLYAVLSLEKTEDVTEIESLNILGKDLLERLEKEFFAIEDKNLESIKKAFDAIFEKPVEGISISFTAGALVNNILYLFGLGNSKVFIKRNGNLGLALDAKEASRKITSSSGFLKEEDLIVLTTEAFLEVIPQTDLDISLDDSDPTEITETLAPKIHESENGKISAIVIRYNNPLLVEEIIKKETEIDESAETTQKESPKDNSLEPEIQTEKSVSFIQKYFSIIKSKFKKRNFKIRPTKKIFLILAAVIIGVLIFSIRLAIKEQENAKIRAIFSQTYPQAQKEYEEGLSLIDLNKNYARDSFEAAKKVLNDNIAKFPEKSKELAQTQDLLKKIDSGLTQVSPIDKSGLDRSKLSIIVKNGSGTAGTAGKGSEILKALGYNVVSTGNADNYSYKGVTIKVKEAKKEFINLIKQDLEKEYTITASSADLSPDSSTDATIIIGK